MTTLKSKWCFVWNSYNNKLVLHDKSKEEAYEIAKKFGWSPRVWYKPATWGNNVIFLGEDN